MRILIGLVAPDSGEIAIDGRPSGSLTRKRPRPSASAWSTSTSASSTSCGCGRTSCSASAARLDRRAARNLVGEIGERYGLGLDPDAVVGDLTAGFRQRVEIVKCLRRDPDIVIFDEPTSVLTPQESEQLFAVLRVAVAAERKAVALVSHKLDEILHATDVVTILRRGRRRRHDGHARRRRPNPRPGDGRATGLAAPRGTGPRARRGTARCDSDPTSRRPSPHRSTGAAHQRCGRPRHGRAVLDHLSLDVHAGEIVGVAGVEGNGQAELADVLGSLLTSTRAASRLMAPPCPTGHAGADGRGRDRADPRGSTRRRLCARPQRRRQPALGELGRGRAPWPASIGRPAAAGRRADRRVRHRLRRPGRPVRVAVGRQPAARRARP